MKSTELFDLLGEIDDKFYEEARIPDEQYGVEIVSEHRPFRGFMSIFMPIAACVVLIAAVAVGANFIQRNAGLVYPNDSDSELSSDAPLIVDRYVSSETSTSSVSDGSDDIELLTETELLENYPPIDFDSVPDIKGNGLEVQMTQQDKTLQKATLGTFKRGEYGKYTLYMLGEYIHIDKSNDPDCLYAYNVKLAVVKDGKVIGTDGTHTTSVSMGQGGYRLSVDELKIMAEGKISYLEYCDLCESNIVIFRYNLPKDGSYERDYECTFYTITDSDELRLLMGDTSDIGGSGLTASVFLYNGFILDSGWDTITDKDVIYKFFSKNFGSNPYDGAPHFIASEYVNPDDVLDLSEYPPVDISKIPDVGEKVYNSGLDLPNATIAEKQVGEYTITIIGDGLRTSPLFQDHPLIQKTGNMIIMAENARVVISRDGKIIKVTHENGAGDTDIYFDAGEEVFASYLFPDVYEMKDGIVFGLNRRTMYGDVRPRFGTIVDDDMKQFKASATSYDGRVDPFENLTFPVASEDVTLLADENTLIIDGVTCIFDFDTLTFSDTVNNGSDKGSDIDLSEYPLIDEADIPDVGENPDNITNAIPKATIVEKQVGEYTLSVIGKNLRTSSVLQNEFLAESICSVISRDGKIIRVTHENGTGVRTLVLSMNEFEDLLPDAYEMKNGIVFGLDKKSVQLSGTPSFGTIKHDVMLEFTAPALGVDQRDPFDGTVSEANGAVTVLPEENALILDNTMKYVFDFDKVAYSETIVEPEKFNFDNYKPFNSELLDTIQPHAILDVKETGEYKFYLLGDDVKVLSAKEFTNVNYTKLIVAAERNGEIVAFADMDNIHMFWLDNVSELLQPFEMKDGIGFVMYYHYELFGDHEAMIYKLKNDKITKLTYEYDYAPAPATGSPHYVGSDFGIDYDNNAIIVGDNKLTLDFNQNVFSETAREI